MWEQEARQHLSDLVTAALAAARESGRDVADVPLAAIAAAAGVSRSTLLRRVGGSRAILDEAVRQAGVDPGGRPPVRERAIAAAAELVAERGLGALTLDAVAERARCSLPSLHTIFDGRDGLLLAVYELHGPLPELEALAAAPPEGLEDTVRAASRAVVTTFSRQPRVLPAIFADLFSRPDGPAARVVSRYAPRVAETFAQLLARHIEAGRVRPLPMPILIQLLMGPIVTHVLVRPVLEPMLGAEFPTLEESSDHFAEAFLRAVTLPGPPGTTDRPVSRPGPPESDTL